MGGRRPAYLHRLGLLTTEMGSTVTKSHCQWPDLLIKCLDLLSPARTSFTLENLCFVRRASEEANYLQTCFYCYVVTGLATLTQYTLPS